MKDLVHGMTDPDSDVRNNLMRGLAVIASFAQNTPNQRIKVPIEPFISMLNSIVWSDRNKASFALYQLTFSMDDDPPWMRDSTAELRLRVAEYLRCL